MKKVTEFVKTNKKIIIVVVLLAALLLAVYFINKSGKAKDSTVSTDVAGKSTTENKLCAILKSINGVGEANVMINEGEGGILGVVIVCEGADNIITKNNVLNAVSTALNIDKSLIAIYSMTV